MKIILKPEYIKELSEGCLYRLRNNIDVEINDWRVLARVLDNLTDEELKTLTVQRGNDMDHAGNPVVYSGFEAKDAVLEFGYNIFPF
jgi:hypothetical protein